MALETVNRRDLSRLVADHLQRPTHDVDEVVKAMLRAMTEALEDGSSVSLRGFGTFEPRPKAAIERRRPDTGDMVMDPPHVRTIFRPSKQLKNRLNAALASKQ